MATEKRLDLVEREAIKDAIGFMNLHFLGHGENKSLLDSINEVPSVDAVEVVHGKAVPIYSDIDYEDTLVRMDRQCNKCGALMTQMDNYCPNCGAMVYGDGNG